MSAHVNDGLKPELQTEKQGKPVCECGRTRRSHFHHFCDGCFGRLPRNLKDMLVRHAAGSNAGRALKAEAQAWLKVNPEMKGMM